MNAPRVVAEKIVSPNSQSEADTQLRGRRLVLARVAWIVLALLTLMIFIGSIPTYLAEFQSICTGVPCTDARQLTPASSQALQLLGISVNAYQRLAWASMWLPPVSISRSRW